MKKLVLVFVLIASNMSLISCDHSGTAETETLYQNLSATEGDDGQIEKDPDAEDPDEPGDGN